MYPRVLQEVVIRTPFALSAAAFIVIALSACTTAPAPWPSPSPSETVDTKSSPEPLTNTAAPQNAPSLAELHEKYTASGLPCEWAVTENRMLGSTESGACRNSENAISTFAAQADVDALLRLNKNSIEPGIFLVGDRWVLSSQHPEDLITARTTMSGELWSKDSPFSANR
jgi:hypothetical protein